MTSNTCQSNIKELGWGEESTNKIEINPNLNHISLHIPNNHRTYNQRHTHEGTQVTNWKVWLCEKKKMLKSFHFVSQRICTVISAEEKWGCGSLFFWVILLRQNSECNIISKGKLSAQYRVRMIQHNEHGLMAWKSMIYFIPWEVRPDREWWA